MQLLTENNKNNLIDNNGILDTNTPGSNNLLTPAKGFTMRPMTSCKSFL